MRILFTGGGGAATHPTLNELCRVHDVHFTDADPDSQPWWLPRERWHVTPRGDAPDYAGFMVALCHAGNVDLLVPGVDEELLPIARARESFPCKVLLPSAEFIERHQDKYASMQYLSCVGVVVPRTDLFVGTMPMPCIVKPRRGRGSRDVVVRRSADAARSSVAFASSESVVQELLVGQEYTVTCVADQQMNLRAVVPVKVGLKRGVTLRAETDHDETVTALCVAIHKADPFSGVVNVQCIKAADGTVKPFEINPRLSTTTCLAMAAGVDVLGLALSEGLAPFRHVSLRRSWETELIG